MKNVGGWDFAAEKLADRKKAGSGSGFLTGMARFFGKTLGRVLNLIITPFSAFHLIRGGITSLGSKSDFQEKRTHDEIPGWNGRKYKQDPDGNANILADFRKVPTVWSKLTADNAVDDKGNPLPPEVSINVSQPQEGVDQTMNGMDSGHSGMGIEYTRFNKATGRYERYRLRFGYYMAGGGTFSTMVMGSYKGAVTPGQLRDESSQQYTISRKFKANSKQVNAILQAARTYADKGYQPYTRNCTTFVRDMMQVGNIAGAKNVVDSVRPKVSNFGNLGIFGGEVVLSNCRAGQERNFAKLGRLNDQSYAGWGNKRVTKEDYRLYNESLKNGEGFSKGGVVAETPNSAAENLRRVEHDNAGDFGSFDYASPSLRTDPNDKTFVSLDWFALGRACGKEADNVLQIVSDITPPS